MTDEMMTLRSLVEKAPDANLLREMIGTIAPITDNPVIGLPATAD